jgi:ABC-2 type transport system permease protein
MSPDPAAIDPAAATVVARLTARRAARSGALWGLVFGVYVVSSVTSYTTIAKTAAQRAKLAASFGTNAGTNALLGIARRIDTVAGFTAWRSLGVLTMAGAIWALLIATRLTRGEEDAGRWELLLAGQTARGRAAWQAMAGLAAGLASLWAVTAVISVAVGHSSRAKFTTSGSLFLSVALVASAAMFLAVGAVCGQLAASRHQANGMAAAVFGAAFLVRMVADSGSGIEWLRWASPLGWVEELHPLTGSRPMALAPIIALTVTACVAATWVASRRDLGASALAAHDSRPARTALLGGPLGLAVRLTRPVAIGWVAGLAVLGLVGGLVAQSASGATSGSATVQRAMARLGAHRGGAASYLAIFFVMSAGVVAFAAAGQLAATRNEEAEGYVELLFARPVGRGQWLAGRVAVAAALVLVAGVATGLAAWVGAATQHSGVGLGELTQAGFNLALPALFVLGLGALAYGLAPRLASAATYGVVAWSFLLQLIGSGLKLNHWLLDTSVLAHIAPAPAANPNWAAAGWLAGLGLLGLGTGVVAFNRRDVASA